MSTNIENIPLKSGERLCAKCGGIINLNSSAWYDQYNNGGSQVHFKCLSGKRLSELNKEKEKTS